MLKRLFPFVIGIVMLAAVGCGDDGGADPVIELNDPNSPRQPTGVAGVGGGAPAPAPDASGGTKTPSTN
jgi:hypothetical protein